MPTGRPNLPKYLTVQPGEVWRAGPHWFGCGDIEDGETMARLLAMAPTPTLMYADPPWNNGDARHWRTQAGAPDRPVIGSEVAARLITPAKTLGLLAYVESGIPHLDEYQTMAKSLGAQITGSWTTRAFGRDTALFAADFRGGSHPADHPDFEGQSDTRTPLMALQHVASTRGSTGAPGVVLDPCCGLGITSRAAHQAGWVSVNHELNPNRMGRALESLADLGLEPERLG